MVIACFLALYPLANVQAFDGKREGFFFGAGIGFGGSVYNTVHYSHYYDPDSHLYNNPFPAINYKIGYAPSERVLVYLTIRSSLNRCYGYYCTRDFYTSGIAGLGFMAFLERHDNFYLFWEAGLAARNVLHPNDYYIGDMLINIGIGGMFDSESYFGPCMSGGIGYEISPNLVFDFTLTLGGFNDYHSYVGAWGYLTGDGGNYAGDLVNFSLAFNVLFY